MKEETSSRNKLKNLLILLARLLALTFLIFAFAQPFIPSQDQRAQGRKSVSIYVDNSFSMSALTNDVSLLNKARQKAQEIVAAYGDDERFQILSNDFTALQQRLLTKEEALAGIDAIKARPEVYKLSQVLNRQRQALNRESFDTKVYYQISDFQKNITDRYELQDSNEQMNLIPLQAVQDLNVSIDTVWFATKVPMVNQSNQLVIKLTNHSNEDREGVRLSVNFDNQNRPLGLKNIKAKASIQDTVNLRISKSGWNTAEINIVDYPIIFDDTYKVAFEVKDKISVLAINQGIENQYLKALFQGIDFIEADNQDASRVAYSNFVNYQLIILNDLTTVSSGLTSALTDYVENGGNLLVFPGKNANLPSVNDLLTQLTSNTITAYEEVEKQVGQINTEEFIFKDVFEQRYKNIKLPQVTGTFGINQLQARGEEVILAYRDGKTYIGKYKSGSGHIYLCAAPLSSDVNDLVQNAEIFVPMLFKMSVSSSNSGAISNTIGKNRVIDIENEKTNSDIVYKVIGEQEFIPGQLNAGRKVILNMGDNITQAGFYDVNLGDRMVKKLAFNYDNLESEIDYYNAASLKEMYGDGVNVFMNQLESNFTQIIEEKNQGTAYWKWCILLVLIFLGIEQVLLRIRS